MSGLPKLKNFLKKYKSTIQKIVITLLVCLNLFIFLKPNFFLNSLSGKTPLLDFDSYLLMVENAKAGTNPYISDGMVTLGPPLVLLYFIPFSYLSIEVARILTTLLNIICGITLCFLLAKNYFSKRFTISFLTMSALLFSSFPVRFSIGMGQPALLIALLITLVIIQKNKNLNGFLLAGVSIIKSFFLFSFLAFLRKNRITVIISILTLIIVTLLTFWVLKPEWYLYYFLNNFPKLFSTEVVHTWPDYYNQSLANTLYRLGIGGLHEIIFTPLLLLTGVLVFLTSNFALSIATILLSPVSWQHYYTVFFPIFVMVFVTSKKSMKNISLLFTVFALLLWWVEFPWIHTAPQNLFTSILASHYFISGLILSFLLLKKK